jgi:3-oxoadipate enol-lactonase
VPKIECGKVILHYLVSGKAGGPPLVLANSLGSSMRMWEKVLPALEERFRVVRFDMRGHGESSVPQGPYSIEQLGEDLISLMDAVGVSRAHVCGLSLGGLVAMWVGIHRADRVSRIVLANTAARIGTRDGWEQRILAVREIGMDSIASQMPGRWFTEMYRAGHPDEMESIRQMVASTAPEGYSACCAALRDADLCDQIDLIDAPCLVVAGTHDPATTLQDGRALHAALRRSTYVELDASHLSAWERHEEFSNVVLSFLCPEEMHHG